MPHATVQPRKVLVVEVETETRRLRTYGYAAVCSCGWREVTRRTWAEARGDAQAHMIGEHRKAAAS